MTSPVEIYASAGRGPDRDAPFGQVVIEIAIVALLTGVAVGIFGLGLVHRVEGVRAVVSGIAETLPLGANVAERIVAGLLAAGLAGPVCWGILVWLGMNRLVLGILLISGGWLLWTVIVMASFVLANMVGGQSIPEALEALSAFINQTSPASVIFKLATFAGIWPATWAVLRLLHGQRFGTLLSPEGRMRWSDFGGGLALAGTFWLITLVFGIAVVGMPERTDLSLAGWGLAIVPLVVMVFFQASAEELIFRGYILQQLAARWRNPLIWGFLPAFLFGLAHYSSGANLGIGWHYVVATLLFGLTASALVWRTGSLAAAMGLHTGMNVFSLSGIGLEGIIEGTQLFLYDHEGAEILFVADSASTLCILLFVLSPLCPFRAREVAA